MVGVSLTGPQPSEIAASDKVFHHVSAAFSWYSTTFTMIPQGDTVGTLPLGKDAWKRDLGEGILAILLVSEGYLHPGGEASHPAGTT